MLSLTLTMSCRCPKLVAFSGEIESSTQVLTLQRHLPACSPSLRHMLLAASVSMAGLESAIAALGPVVCACSELQSFNICLQNRPCSSAAPENKQVGRLVCYQPSRLTHGMKTAGHVLQAAIVPLPYAHPAGQC